MALLIPDVGEAAMLDELLKNTTPEAQKLKLYESNTTPAEGDTHASYTEATIAGYSLVTFTRGTWGAASTSVGTTTSTYPEQTFTFSGSGTVYGYTVTKSTAGTLLWAELVFSGGQAFISGDVLKLTCKLQLG